MNTTYTILITLAIIAVLILVHEFGHFVVARKIGIPVWEFSLGFGYRLFGINRNGTEYSIRVIPLGGYVRMSGEEPGDADDPNGYNNRTPWEKMLVCFAGPFMNVVLAMVLFIFIFSVVGMPESSNNPVIGRVFDGKPAQQAGIKVGDRITSVNGVSIKSWDDITSNVEKAKTSQTIELGINRSGQAMTVKVKPYYNKTLKKNNIGIGGVTTYSKVGILKAVTTGFQATWELTIALLGGLGILVTGKASMGDLAGPVGITTLVGEVAQIGWYQLLYFTGFLSINLGILNLLPIPALDGSKIVFGLVEAIRRKPLDPEKEGFIHWLGFLFLIGLMILVTFNDIVKIYKG